MSDTLRTSVTDVTNVVLLTVSAEITFGRYLCGFSDRMFSGDRAIIACSLKLQRFIATVKCTPID